MESCGKCCLTTGSIWSTQDSCSRLRPRNLDDLSDRLEVLLSWYSHCLRPTTLTRCRHSQSDTSISQDLLDLSVSRGPLVLLDQDTGSGKFPPSSVRAIPCTATGDSSKLVFALTTSAGTAETYVDSDTSWHTQEVRARSCT